MLTPAGGDRDGEARAGDGSRRAPARDPRHASTTPCGSAASSAERDGFVLVNSLNRTALEGQKTVVG